VRLYVQQTVITLINPTFAIFLTGLSEPTTGIFGPIAIPETSAMTVTSQPEVVTGTRQIIDNIVIIVTLEFAAIFDYDGQRFWRD
jgi:hypothetical protein